MAPLVSRGQPQGACVGAAGASPAKPRLVIATSLAEGLGQVTLSPDGRYAVACGSNAMKPWERASWEGVKLWEVSSGIELWSKHDDEIGGVIGAAFASDFSTENPHVFLRFGVQLPGVPPRPVWDVRSDAWVRDSPYSITSAGQAASSAAISAFLRRQSSTAVARPTDRAEFTSEARSIRVKHGERTVAWDGVTGSPREDEPAVALSDGMLSLNGRFKLDVHKDPRDQNWVVGVVDNQTSTCLRRLQYSAGKVVGGSLSNDGNTILMLDEGRDLARLDSTGTHDFHGFRATSVSLSPDARLFVTASRDGITRVWNVETGALVCSLVSFLDGTWAVADPEGRYDAPNGGNGVEGLYWVVGLERIALSQLKDRYYEPGLLGKTLGWIREPLREVSQLSALELYPQVTAEADWQTKVLEVALTDRGGGFGPVRVAINNKLAYEIAIDVDGKPVTDPEVAKVTLERPSPREVHLTISFAGHAFLLPAQNRIVVTALNEKKYLSSRGSVLDEKGHPWDRGSMVPPPPEPHGSLYAVVCGISRYAGGDGLKLSYAAKDALDFAHALELAAQGLFTSPGKVEVTRLSTALPGPSEQPTRANLEAAFRNLAAPGKVSSTDVLVIFLAGHGVSYGGPDDPDGGFYYLTADATSGEHLSDPGARKLQTVASHELTDWIRDIPALKQVMILDTCHAGRLVEDLSSARDIPANQTRALERLKDRTGMFVLAGAAADAVSYETSKYAQGLLTYSLLLGMESSPDDDIDVSQWFNYAVDKVSELARGIGGIQKPVMNNPAPLARAGSATVAGKSAGSFPVGQLGREARGLIKENMKTAVPFVVRASLQDELQYLDRLGLEEALNGALREESAADGPRLSFVDRGSLTGAYRLIGRYRVDGEKLVVSAGIFCDDKLEQELKQLVTPKETAGAAAELVKRLLAAIPPQPS